MTTWGTRYGASGGHPGLGFLTPRVVLLNGGFAVRVNGTSNLRDFQGVDLSAAAAGVMQRLQPPIGAAGDEGVAWDLRPAASTVQGVATTGSLSDALRLFESTSFVRSCDSAHLTVCRSNTPEQPVGGSFVWSTPAFQFENVLAYAARNAYANRAAYRGYACVLGACGAEIHVGQNGDPSGWADYRSAFGSGAPPDAAYLWESLSEVAQVALHRYPTSAGGVAYLAEGQANARLPITLDVHFSDAQLLSAVLAGLNSHRAGLDQRALGNYAAANADLDFFVARADDGQGYLAFVSAADPRPVAGYPYANPGLFTNTSLNVRASAPVVLHAGEASHEAVRLSAGVGQTLYLLDASNALYRVRAALDTSGSAVNVAIARAL